MKKSIICLLLLLFFSLIYVCLKTYGLYEDNLTGEVVGNTASFVFKINNITINNDNNTFNIDSFNIVNNSHANNQKLAPKSNGYFDIVLVPEDVKVSVLYNITFDLSNITNEKIKFDSVINNDTSMPLTRTAQYTYTGVMSLADVTNHLSNTIRVNLRWENDEANNEIDSKMEGTTLEIPVTINLAQYLGEEIIEYTG
jgi:hypothetical protein